MLAAALWWNIGNCTFKNLQQRLLHTFAGDVAGDGRVFVLATDFIDLIDIDDAGLAACYVTVGSLQQLQDDVFDVFADVAGFGKSCCIDDGEGHVKHLREGMGEQRFTAASWADEEDVRLRQLHVRTARAVHLDAFVVIVDSHCQFLLGRVLADHVFVQKRFHFLRLGKVRRCCSCLSFSTIIFEDGVADRDALIADIRARVVAGRGDELGDSILRLVAERTT